MISFKVWSAASLVIAALYAAPATATASKVPVCVAPSPPAQTGELADAPLPFLDDPGKIVFRERPKLDRLILSGRAVPLTSMDPQAEPVTLTLSNVVGTVYKETIPAGSFEPNAKLTSWKYTRKKVGSSLIYSFKIKKRFNRNAGNTEFLLKAKTEAALDYAHPERSNRQQYLVHLRLATQTALSKALQFSVDYRGANGDFAGSRFETLQCEKLAGTAVAAFNDDDIGSLHVAIATLDGLADASDIAQCVFATNSGAPLANDFEIRVVDAVEDIPQKDGSNVCGAPATGYSRPAARDAYYVLEASIGNVDCDSCECDVTSNGVINSSDSLRVLQAAVGGAVPLTCPWSSACADQPTVMSAGNATDAVVQVSSIEALPPQFYTTDQLKTMTVEIAVEDDVFYNTSPWAAMSYGWYLADEYLWE